MTTAQSASKRSVFIVEPDSRRGANVSVFTNNEHGVFNSIDKGEITLEKSNVAEILSGMNNDSNFLVLKERFSKMQERFVARLTALKVSIEQNDGEQLFIEAYKLTEAAGELGASRLMTLCISLQMLARRSLFDEAAQTVEDILTVFKEACDSLGIIGGAAPVSA